MSHGSTANILAVVFIDISGVRIGTLFAQSHSLMSRRARDNNSRRTVLVVEDYDDVRQVLRILLESENFCVLEASNGAEALKILRSGRPDVILMDLALPGIDGFETIRRIRKIDGFQNTPIIILSAFTGRSVGATARRAGIDFVMTKPVDFDELAELLERIFEDATVRNSKPIRSSAQRAVINGKVTMPRTMTREIHLST